MNSIRIYIWYLFILLFSIGCGKGETDFPDEIRIGVMLPYSGEYVSDWDHALDWAAENVNLAGGVAGRRLVLVKKDIARDSLMQVGSVFASYALIKAVIGPLSSSDVFTIAPSFINAKKILVAPVATAASISKAFAGKKYFWRLSESDISQIKTSGDAHKILVGPAGEILNITVKRNKQTFDFDVERVPRPK